ncbi:DUF3784 domain-containing protein [Bacillus benzoevorans]|uniref:Putative membrane protein SirB2 n=1 Tax=Bacillus benzoevorans TaxID=1456 RepID=A0A7X0HVL3_9BACI|nr:DUF3784 domain-containing protein [Bacillus benzoevorans]MBB6446406.1 putative membrane protein SirB2 [Bacillus benzoevorans]
MWILFAVELFVIVLFIVLGWLIRYRKKYGLISGFVNRPKEEQEQLIFNGYPQKTGSLLILTAFGMLLLLPLIFTPFRYTIEVQFGFMLLFLLGGFIFLSKYEVAKKRKRSYWISSSLFVLVVSFVTIIMSLGYQDYELTIGEEQFSISGVYGDQWEMADIEQIQLLAEMPKVKWKENGFGMQTMAKGYFTVEGYDSSLLFIHHNARPIMYIKVNDKNIFINGESAEQTKNWYEQLSKKAGI